MTHTQTALVTGASRGIGAATVRRLRADGHNVVAMARSQDALAALAEETGCEPLVCDLTDDGALDDALDGLRVDILVNNAGLITSAKPFAEQTVEDIDRQLTLNLRATLVLTQKVLPQMIARGSGHLVMVTSLIARHPFPNVTLYAATKGGMHAFAQTLRMELAGTGVRLTEVAPGRVETDIYLESQGGDRDKLSGLFNDYEALQPDDVAAAIQASLNLPARASAAFMELSPTDQAVGGAVFAKRRIG
ncbi:MAG: SDR family oxidoreductase [Pseudomonadota bacterium]